MNTIIDIITIVCAAISLPLYIWGIARVSHKNMNDLKQRRKVREHEHEIQSKYENEYHHNQKFAHVGEDD